MTGNEATTLPENAIILIAVFFRSLSRVFPLTACTLVSSYSAGQQKGFAQTVALRVGRGRRNEAREMFHQYVKLLAATAERLQVPVP